MQNYSYKVVLKNTISALDQKILTYLYLPIIGPRAMALYQFFAYEYEVSKELKCMKISEERILKNLGYSADAFERQCKKLEAINLLEILQNDKRNSKIYNIYAPLEAGDFFNNNIFSGLLLKNIGQDDFDIAKFIFKDEGDVLEEQGYTKRTVSINDAFQGVDEIQNLNIPQGMKSKPRKTNPLLKDLNLDDIISKLSEVNIYTKRNDKTMKLIENIYSLYKIPVEKIIKAIINTYDFVTFKVDEEKFNAFLSFDLHKEDFVSQALVFDEQAEINEKHKIKIYEYEKIDPIDYLASLTAVKSLDDNALNIIAKLQGTYKMRNAVINCLLDFSYFKNNGKIVSNYLFKIAATMKELDIKTAQAAMNYLKEAAKQANKSTFKPQLVSNSETVGEPTPVWNVPQDPNGYKVSDVIDEDGFNELWGQS